MGNDVVRDLVVGFGLDTRQAEIIKAVRIVRLLFQVGLEIPERLLVVLFETRMRLSQRPVGDGLVGIQFDGLLSGADRPPEVMQGADPLGGNLRVGKREPRMSRRIVLIQLKGRLKGLLGRLEFLNPQLRVPQAREDMPIIRKGFGNPGQRVHGLGVLTPVHLALRNGEQRVSHRKRTGRRRCTQADY